LLNSYQTATIATCSNTRRFVQQPFFLKKSQREAATYLYVVGKEDILMVAALKRNSELFPDIDTGVTAKIIIRRRNLPRVHIEEERVSRVGVVLDYKRPRLLAQRTVHSDLPRQACSTTSIELGLEQFHAVKPLAHVPFGVP
jgi:hypothetical protein